MDSLETVRIFDVPISRLNLDQTLRYCENRVDKRQGGYICFVNVHSITESLTNSPLKSSFENATLLAADGMPLVWRSKMKKKPVHSRVCGPDFSAELLKEHPDWHYGLIGGETAQAKILKEKFNLNLTAYAPPFRAFSPENAREDWKEFLKLAGERPPRIVFVALGAPKQELWMQEVSKIAPQTIFLGVGAALDFLAGNKPRAPKWMQKTGLEWVHRLASEPGRLWKRYLTTNSKFLVESVRETFREKFES